MICGHRAIFLALLRYWNHAVKRICHSIAFTLKPICHFSRFRVNHRKTLVVKNRNFFNFNALKKLDQSFF